MLYEVVKDNGVWYVMKGERIVAGGFATRALAQQWAGRLQKAARAVS